MTSWPAVSAENAALRDEVADLRDLVSNLEASCAELRQERDELREHNRLCTAVLTEIEHVCDSLETERDDLRADRDALAFAIIATQTDDPKEWAKALGAADHVLDLISSRTFSSPREVGEPGSPAGAVPDRTPAPAGAAPSTSSDEGAA